MKTYAQRTIRERSSAMDSTAREPTLPTLFEAQVARDPDALALTFETESLAYGELNARANRLAHHMIGLGVGPESLVGVCLERSVEMVVSLLAILKAGGAYVPLDPDYPAARLTQMMADAAPSVVLSTSALSSGLPPANTTLVLDSGEMLGLLEQAPEHNPTDGERSCKLSPSHPAYVIYTSGSTGTPKGVVVTHLNVVRLFRSTTHWFHFGRHDVWTLFHSYAFDFSVWELWGPLLFGGRLVVVPKIVTRSPAEFLALLVDQGVTVLNQTPSAFYQLMEADGTAPELRDRLSLRYVIFGGEALAPGRLEAWYRRHGETGPLLVNMYGITETTVHVSYLALDCELACMTTGSPIGTSIPDLRVYVLDAALEPVAAGSIGEMYVGGPGLARGYLHRPELTAERFVADPHATTPGQRMYRTGDLARWRPDGSLDFLGRVDHQVKIRGFRIELGEIETALAAHPDVSQAAVIARDDGPGGKRLVAYVVPARQAIPDAVALRGHLAERLPDYMVPSAFVILDSLPLTPNGKLDRKALPAPQRRIDRYRAPSTPDEKALCEIFADVLDIDRVGIDDSFFELGGHSLLATRVVGQARANFGVELPVRALFKAPTVAEFAARLRRGGRVRVPLLRQPRPDPMPLSFAQRRLWFLDRLEGPNATYNIPMALRINGALDLDALQAALADVVARHESLRTIFPERAGVPFQHLLPPHIARCAIAGLDVAEADLAERLAEAATTPFDLAREIPIRVWLFRITPERHVLLVLLHHIASDGWSLGPLWRDLTQAYTARHQGQAPDWAELPVQYADYTLWQRGLLGDDDAPDNPLASQLAFWRRTLAGVPDELSLPFDRPRPPVAGHRGATAPVHLDAALHRRLLEVAQACNASLFMVLQAGFAALLGRLGAGDDIPIGTALAGRTEPELEDLVGFFVNTLVLRTDLTGDPTFRELVSRVRAFALDAFAHQDIPFERVVEAIRPVRSAARQPLFQVMFVLQNTPGSELILPGLSVHEEPIAGVTSKFDLTLNLREILERGKQPAGIEGGIEYNLDLFDPSTIETIAARFVRLLEQAAARPDDRLHHFCVLENGERHKLLEEFNATACPVPESTISELFEAQVARDPDAVALVLGSASLSYRDLNTRANRVAHHLISLGVRTETLVGVCLDRSFDMVVALLGIVKAGAAYVPIAPELPTMRRDALIADAGLRHMLTTRAYHDFFARRVAHVVIVDDMTRFQPGQYTQNPTVASAPTNLAYLNYTSGTSGGPKAVAVPNIGVVRLVHEPNYVRLDTSSRLLQIAPLSFDAATFEIWGALLNGGALVIMPPGPFSPQDVGSAIIKADVNTLFLTTGLFNACVTFALPALAGVRQLLTGGEVISVEHVEQVLRAHTDCQVIHCYGPTENTTFTCCYRLPRDPEFAARVPIGAPINNTRQYVLDSRLELAPVGVEGELYVAGLGLARGYLNRPGLTAERFVADPHATTPGQRMYRTGDLARWRPDGTIEFLGRVDHQVKIRGFRIELGEIETALMAHPAVAQAVVITRDGGPAGRQLVAYVVEDHQQALSDTTALRRHLAERLPDYMVPSAFVILETLPLTPNGKIDRRALPEPGRNGTAASDKPLRPRTLLELDIARIWQRLFERDDIGPDDDFFALGGHSLLAVRLVAELEHIVQRRLPIATLLQSPTIASLARTLSDEAWAPAWQSVVPMQTSGSGPAIFCVHGKGGEVYDFLDLAREFSGVRKVYGLQAVGLDGRQPRHTSIEEMADHYAGEIRGVQPDGPYHLMGHSLGGWITYAVAQALTRQGSKVGVLAVLDTHENCILPWNLRARIRLANLVTKIRRHAGQLRNRQPLEWRAYLKDRWKNVRSRQANAARGRTDDGASAGPTDRPRTKPRIDHYLALVASYRPTKYDADIDIFLADGTDDSILLFWKRLTRGRLRVHHVAGEHLTMIDKNHAKQFAQLLKQVVDQAEARRDH